MIVAYIDFQNFFTFMFLRNPLLTFLFPTSLHCLIPKIQVNSWFRKYSEVTVLIVSYDFVLMVQEVSAYTPANETASIYAGFIEACLRIVISKESKLSHLSCSRMGAIRPRIPGRKKGTAHALYQLLHRQRVE